jgi:tRNA threonylcarbamoyl adenosine modification protein YeaZ
MYLFINTSKDQQFDVFLLANNKIIKHISKKGNYKVSENLLTAINNLLSKSRKRPGDLKGIVVVIGPGAFTSLRIAVVVANTLGFCLHIPLVGLINDHNLNDQKLADLGIQKMKFAKPGIYLQPFYNYEPNITRPKS